MMKRLTFKTLLGIGLVCSSSLVMAMEEKKLEINKNIEEKKEINKQPEKPEKKQLNKVQQFLKDYSYTLWALNGLAELDKGLKNYPSWAAKGVVKTTGVVLAIPVELTLNLILKGIPAFAKWSYPKAQYFEKDTPATDSWDYKYSAVARAMLPIGLGLLALIVGKNLAWYGLKKGGSFYANYLAAPAFNVLASSFNFAGSTSNSIGQLFHTSTSYGGSVSR